jgi:hypothetical protein
VIARAGALVERGDRVDELVRGRLARRAQAHRRPQRNDSVEQPQQAGEPGEGERDQLRRVERAVPWLLDDVVAHGLVEGDDPVRLPRPRGEVCEPRRVAALERAVLEHRGARQPDHLTASVAMAYRERAGLVADERLELLVRRGNKPVRSAFREPRDQIRPAAVQRTAAGPVLF